MVRLQLDTLLRLNAARLYEGGLEEFSQRVFHGESINKLKSHENQRITDACLARKVSEEHPWVQNVYKELCDLVHFSDRHIFASMTMKDERTRTVHFMISTDDPPRPDEDYFEMIDGYYAILKATGQYVVGWAAAVKQLAA